MTIANLFLTIKHKKLFIILLVFFFLLIIFLLLTNRPKPTSKTAAIPEKSSTSSFSDLINQFPASSETTKPFFLNFVETLRNVNGYSWLQNQLIYSTPEGIYSADSNQPLLNTKIEQINWNSQAQAVFSNNKQWFFFDSANKDIKPLNLLGSLAKLHPSKPFVAILNDSTLNVYSLTDPTQPIFTTYASADNFFWAMDLPIVTFQTDRIETFNLSNQENNLFLYLKIPKLLAFLPVVKQ